MRNDSYPPFPEPQCVLGFPACLPLRKSYPCCAEVEGNQANQDKGNWGDVTHPLVPFPSFANDQLELWTEGNELETPSRSCSQPEKEEGGQDTEPSSHRHRHKTCSPSHPHGRAKVPTSVHTGSQTRVMSSPWTDPKGFAGGHFPLFQLRINAIYIYRYQAS